MLSDLDNFGLTVLVAGMFCIVAIGISCLMTKIKSSEVSIGKYECGFVNVDKINFIDKKLYVVPSFIAIEMLLLWLVFYTMTSVFTYISIQSVCLYFYLIIFIVCSYYSEKEYNIS